MSYEDAKDRWESQRDEDWREEVACLQSSVENIAKAGVDGEWLADDLRYVEVAVKALRAIAAREFEYERPQPEYEPDAHV